MTTSRIPPTSVRVTEFQYQIATAFFGGFGITAIVLSVWRVLT